VAGRQTRLAARRLLVWRRLLARLLSLLLRARLLSLLWHALLLNLLWHARLLKLLWHGWLLNLLWHARLLNLPRRILLEQLWFRRRGGTRSGNPGFAVRN